MWFWLAGDERMLPAPGLELPLRTEGRYRRAFEDGLMWPSGASSSRRTWSATSRRWATRPAPPPRHLGYGGGQLRRGALARISLNYVINMWSGTSETIKALRGQSQFEHELLLRFAMSSDQA